MPELGDFVILTQEQIIRLAEYDHEDRLRVVVIWAEIALEAFESLIFADTEVRDG